MIFFSKLIPNLLARTATGLIKSSQIIRSFSIFTKPANFPSLNSVSMFAAPSISLVQVRGVKVRSAVKKRCKDCYSVRRSGVLYIRCKVHPRHKQRQG